MKCIKCGKLMERLEFNRRSSQMSIDGRKLTMTYLCEDCDIFMEKEFSIGYLR